MASIGSMAPEQAELASVEQSARIFLALPTERTLTALEAAITRFRENTPSPSVPSVIQPRSDSSPSRN